MNLVTSSQSEKGRHVDFPESFMNAAASRHILRALAAGGRQDADNAAICYAAESSWVTFRWGPKYGEPYPNTQFPIEAADEYFPQTVSTYRDQQETLNSVAAFAALIDKVPEPVIMLVIRPARLSHGRGAARAGEGHSGDRDLGHGLRCNPAGRSAEVCGYTNPDRDQRPCPGSRRRLAQVSKRDGADWGPRDVLPEAGIYGNGHTMMLDKQ